MRVAFVVSVTQKNKKTDQGEVGPMIQQKAPNRRRAAGDVAHGLHVALESKPRGKLEYKEVPRQFPLGLGRPEGAEQIEPLRYQACKNWTWWRNTHTGQRHKRTCNRCRDCRNFKHERIVSQAIAECVTAVVAMSFTLTYADIDFCELAAEAQAWMEEAQEEFEEALADGSSQFRINVAHSELTNAQRYVSDIKREARIVGAYDEYNDCCLPGSFTPAGGQRLDYRHVELFLKRLRKAGYQFNKVSAGEYGGKGARAHWHLLVMFEHDPDTKANILEAVRKNEEWDAIQPSDDWRERAPAYTANLRGKEFTDAIEDPDVLVVSYPQKGRKTPKIRNTQWRFWPHGIVEAQVCKAPGFNHPEQVEGAVRYCLKYLSKDAWKDSRKFQRIPFWELPEHIRQQTRFGPWKEPDQIEKEWSKSVALGNRDETHTRPLNEEWRKWSFGNHYRRELERALLEDFKTEEDVPLHRQLYKGLYNYKATGGMGHAYFEALGRQVCHNWKKDEAGRGFKLGANYRHKRRNAHRSEEAGWKASAYAGGSQLFVHAETGQTVLVPRERFNYVMGDTAYRSFWRGYNAELADEGRGSTMGPDDVVDTLDTSRAKANDSSSGSFGHSWYSGLSKSQRANVEERTAEMPNRKLKGLFPLRWIKDMEDTSQCLGWREKGLERLRIEYLKSLERIDKDPAKIGDEPGDKDIFLKLRVKTQEALAIARRQELSAYSSDFDASRAKHLKRYRRFVNEQIERSPVLSDYWPHGWLRLEPAEGEVFEEWHLPKREVKIRSTQDAHGINGPPRVAKWTPKGGS